MTTTVEQHKSDAPDAITCAVITVSDTRTLEDDRGGKLVVELLTAAGHQVEQRMIVKDKIAVFESFLVC